MTPPSPRLLLIDPDAMVRQTLAGILTGAGYDVTAAEAMPGGAFDLVLGDAATLAARPDWPAPTVALTKPVRVGPLLTRVAEMLARPRAARIGPWRFQPQARLLEKESGLAVHLTDKESAILDHLLHAGGVVDRDTLLAQVWGYSAAISTHTLETHIYRLRRKIEADPANAVLLVTEAGGYRLVH